MARQLRLKLKRPPSYAREDFVASPANAEAARALDAWPGWPGRALALVGPEGAGKSHLARIWAQRAGAAAFAANANLAALEGRPVLIEDVDTHLAGGGVSEEALFHLMNMAGSLLLTARTPPLAWRAALPDLRSRLKALTVAELGEPDDALLTRLLEKFFRERNIRPPADIYPYLVRRIERSASAAQAMAQWLDEAADQARRPVTRALARELLEADDSPLERSD